LIASNVFLSSAHCKGVFKKVLIGISDRYALRSTYESISVLAEIQHPSYDEISNENDLMVVILDGNSTMMPICMKSEVLLKKRKNLRVLGYGTTEEGNPSTSLIETDVQYIRNAKCQRYYSKWEPRENDDYYGEWRPEITKDMMCAHSEEGKDACSGDSGGPVILSGDDDTGRGDILVGLVSWGIECGKYPGVYSRVSRSKVGWIRRNVEKYGGILPHC